MSGVADHGHAGRGAWPRLWYPAPGFEFSTHSFLRTTESMSGETVDYRLQVSPRARKVWLRVKPGGGLVVVVPKRFDLARVPGIVREEQAWIWKALARAERQRASAPPAPRWEIPREIALPAIGACWPVAAVATEANRVTVRLVPEIGLRLMGRVADGRACRAALNRWLTRQARVYLFPQLEAASTRLGLRYSGVSVRLQRTRWASCSPRRAISLNGRLLLLSPPLVEYVLVHELCHTAVMSHSRKFWRMVERYCPDYRRLRSELRAASRSLPAWADGDRRFLGEAELPEDACADLSDTAEE